MEIQELRKEKYNERFKPYLPESKFTLLDLGCGEMNYTRFFNFSKCDAVDIQSFDLKIKNVIFHNEDIMSFLKNHIGIKWDVITMLHLIEHLEKKDSIELIEMAKRIVKKCFIVSTPDGFAPNAEYQNIEYQTHLCGFDESELKNIGFDVLRIKNIRLPLKKWHDKTKTPYPKSWDSLQGIYRP